MDNKVRRKIKIIILIITLTIMTFSVMSKAEAKKSKITFNLNGGCFTSDFITEYEEGIETALPTNVLKPGYNFVGWYDNEELTGTAVTKIASTDIGQKTYYASWEVDYTKTGFQKVIAGNDHTIALDLSGNIWTWGIDKDGQIGTNGSVNSYHTGTDYETSSKIQTYPVMLLKDSKFKDISAGSDHTVAIDAEGEIWTWGNNKNGQLGNGTTTNSSIPIKLDTTVKFEKIDAGDQFTVAIDENGNIWAWGYNLFVQLGNTGVTKSLVPIQITNDIKFKEISIFEWHTLAIDEEGYLWGWGRGQSGQLGSGTTSSYKTPTKLMQEKKFKKVAAGFYYSLAIDEEGKLWSWGKNEYGQLGNGNTIDSNIPILIEAEKNFVECSAGRRHSLAIDEDGNLWGWGDNSACQLASNKYGNATHSEYWSEEYGTCKYKIQTIPKIISTTNKIKEISAGSLHTIAIDENKNIVGWGYNSYGNLGTEKNQTKIIDTMFYAHNFQGGKAVYTPETISNYTPITFDLKLNLNDGTIEGTIPTSYNYGEITILPIPTRIGYTFAGWYENSEFKGEAITQINDGEYGEKEYYASWKIIADIVYKVEHYKQNDTLDGYDLADTEELQGTMDETVNATAKQYEGYMLNIRKEENIKTGNILADGSLILKLYYDKIFEQNFNINIINVDGNSDETIANAKYDVIVEYIDGTTKEYLGNITNENGNISISNVNGKNTMKVYIRQAEHIEGYSEYDSQRYIEVKVNSENRLELTGAKTSGVEANIEENTLNIKYLSYMEDLSNTIRINAVDNVDNDIKVANVKFKVTFPDGETEEHITNEDGIIEFRNIESPAMGTFVYQLEQISTPYGYKQNTDKTYIAVTFNEVGTIIKVLSFNLSSNKENNTSIVNEMDVNTQNTITNIDIVEERLIGEGSIFSDYNIKIIERDLDTGAKIQDVKYKITQKVLNNGMTSTITANKVTNENGEIILEFTNGEEILLTIKRTKVPDGYKMLKGEIKIPLIKETDGNYILSSEVEGVTVDNDSKTILVDRNIYKVNSENNKAKEKLNNTIYITKVDRYMRPLQGVTMQLREMASGKAWDLTTDDNGFAKITSKELIEELGCEFPEYLVTQKGKLTFWITEKTVPVGYERINEDIGFEAYYEVDPTGRMQISYMNVLDGLSYYHIVNQEYSEYEEETYVQVDIKLTVMNNYSSGVDIEKELKTFKIEKQDYNNNTIKLGNALFEVTFIHPVSGKIRVEKATKADGILIIPNVYFPEGTTVIEIKELRAPYRYRRINNTMTVTVKNEGGVISVLEGGSIKDNEEILVKIGNVKYGTSYGGGSGTGTIIGGGGSGGSGDPWTDGSGGSGSGSGSGSTGSSGGIGGSWGGSSGGSGGGSGSTGGSGSGGIITGGGSGGSGSGGSESGNGSGGASGTGGSGGTTKPGSGSGSGTITSPIRPGDSERPIFGIQIDKVNKYNDKIRVKDALYMMTILNEESNEQTEKLVNTNDTGRVLLSDLIGFGDFKITIAEIKAPDLYLTDEEKHEIRIHRDQESHMITMLNDDTSENTTVIIDNINKIINMTIKETPKGIGLSILKQDYDDEEITLKNSKFEIIDNETNEKYELITGDEGAEYIGLPTKEDGIHTFTIRELEAPQGYNKLDGDLTLTVNYEKGKIASANVSGTNAEITNQNTEYIEINVLNTKKAQGLKYDIELIKADAYYSSITFENAKIKIDVDNESGMQGITKTALTDKSGKIHINDMYGTGKVSIRITELIPPPERRYDIKEKQVLLNVDSQTGWIKLNQGSSNVDVFIDNDAKKITIRVRNYPDGTFIIGANKVDTQDKDLILLGAKYNILLEETGETFEVGSYEEVLLAAQNIPIPDVQTSAVYTYNITEVQAPFGYALNETPIILKVEVSKEQGINVITNAYIESGNAEVEKYGDEFVHLLLKNTALNGAEGSEEGEGYNINVIKVDSEDKDYRVAGTLIGVHVQAESGENYYKELLTDENGQINLNHIKGTGKVTVTLKELNNSPNYLIANGIKTIEFTRDIETKEITMGTITGDKVTASITEANNVTIVFENTLDSTVATIIKIEKVWVDTEKQKVHRPANIKIQIKNGDTVVTEKVISSTELGTIFTNLPKYDSNGNEITYKVAEVEVNEGDLKYYVSSIEGNTITNTFTLPDDIKNETTNIEVIKVWVDTEEQKVHRPASIKIQIKNGETVVEEKEITNTTENVTFENLPKYDNNGSEITYSIAEKEVNEGELKYYVSNIEGKTITNTFKLPDDIKNETTSITVTKVWEDNNNSAGKRPTSVIIVLNSGENQIGQVELTVANALNENTNTWQGQITDLPKYDGNGDEINYADVTKYTIDEKEKNPEELKFYAKAINQETRTVTNTFTVSEEKVNMEVIKEWVDNNNAAEKRPTSVIIVAKSENNIIGQVELTVANALNGDTSTWQGQIENLPKYDANANVIVYEIDEIEKNSGDLYYYVKTINGNKVTNTLQLEKTRYKVEHYRRTEDEEVEGYICEVEYFEEYPGKFVTAVPKDYEGFVENTSHPNRIPSGIVAADGSLVLKLYYNRERYNITYVLNGGTAIRTLRNNYTYGEELYLSKKVEKSGFEFAGWYDNAECIGEPILKIESGETGDKVFYAKWRKEVITSDKYNIDGVQKYISKVSPETTVNSFIQNMQVDGNIKIYDSKGNEVAPNKFVGTGYKAIVEKNGETYEYEIAVRGDLDGNGKVTATDLSTLNQVLIKKIKLEGIKAIAADIDGNEKITATDLSTLNQAVIKKIKL